MINKLQITARVSKNDPLLTERFYLRDLTKDDISNTWLTWFSETSVNQFILTAQKTDRLLDLQMFLTKRLNLDKVRFFGIFDKKNDLHIGNIKYEPIDIINMYAVMGVLIGNPLYRGIGVFGEIYSASSRYLKEQYPIERIFLCVDNLNISAIKSYQKAGFITTNAHPLGVIHNDNHTVMVQYF